MTIVKRESSLGVKRTPGDWVFLRQALIGKKQKKKKRKVADKQKKN